MVDGLFRLYLQLTKRTKNSTKKQVRMTKLEPTLQDVYQLIFKAQSDPSLVLEQDPRLRMKIDDDSQIYNVYLFGSRLYQCHNEESDYDFICLIGGSYFDGSKLFESEELNVNVYHWDYFMHLMAENMIWAVMLVYAPSEFVWKETRPLRPCFVLDVNRLKTSALQDASHNWAKAKRLCIQDSMRNIKVSKKNIVHGIRYLRLTLQICNYGMITDFTSGNEIWNEVFSIDDSVFSSFKEQWNFYDNKYKANFQDLMHQVKFFVFTSEAMITDQISTSKHAKKSKPMISYMTSTKKRLNVIDYIRKHGVNSLKRDFAINISKPFTAYPELIVCTLDKLATPVWQCESSIVRECSSLILREEENDYTVVASGHFPIFNRYGSEGIDSDFMTDLVNIEWNGARIYEKIDGYSFVLFRYQNEWLLFTPKVTYQKFKKYFMIHIAQYRRISYETDVTLLEHLTQAFWNIWNKSNFQLPDSESKNYSYLFELCLDVSKISMDKEFLIDSCTVQHSEDKIYFHGVIEYVEDECAVVEHEIDEFAERYGWTVPKKFDYIIQGLTTDPVERDGAIKKFVRSLDPMQSEGLVVVDKYFNRLKFVNPQVQALIELQIADLMEPNTNIRNIEVVAKMNDICTFLDCSPWREQSVISDIYAKAIGEVHSFTNYMQGIFDEITAKSASQKEFIDNCRKYRFYYVLFDMQKMDNSAREFYAATIQRKVLRAIKDMETPFELFVK